MLVLIDGEPKLQYNKDLKIDVVVNTPFTIIKILMAIFICTGQNTGMFPMQQPALMNIQMVRFRITSQSAETQIISKSAE